MNNIQAQQCDLGDCELVLAVSRTFIKHRLITKANCNRIISTAKFKNVPFLSKKKLISSEIQILYVGTVLVCLFVFKPYCASIFGRDGTDYFLAFSLAD